MKPIPIVITVSLITSVIIVAVSRAIALRKKLLDLPNIRSSHTRPTPRTGGIGILLGSMAGLIAGAISTAVWPERTFWVISCTLAGGSLLGLVDDIKSLSTLARIVAYLLLSVILALSGALLDSLTIPGLPEIPLGLVAGGIFSVLFIAWYTNLFNFMDGIDGIAGSTAVVTLAALSVVFLRGGSTEMGLLSISAAAASAGFLLLNYPPATVFMGDSGSVFLGMLIGTLSLVAVGTGLISFPAVVFLMMPFVFDSTFTLIRRMIKRERFWAAHRTHIYQKMCDLGFSHRDVVMVFTALSVILALVGLCFDGWQREVQVVVWWGALSILLLLSLGVVNRKIKSSKKMAT